MDHKKRCWKHGYLNYSPYHVTQCIKTSGFSGNQKALVSECALVYHSYCFFSGLWMAEGHIYQEETLDIDIKKVKRRVEGRKNERERE